MMVSLGKIKNEMSSALEKIRGNPLSDVVVKSALGMVPPPFGDFYNGILTASGIGSSLVEEVSRQTGQKGRFQRPIYRHIAGSDDGDFMFKIFYLDQ